MNELRTEYSFSLDINQHFKTKLLQWAQQFTEVIWLDSNDYQQEYSSFDAVLAVDAFTSIQTDYDLGFDKLMTYQSSTNDWVFGYLSYDLKNDTEALHSNNFDGLEFPDLFFFQPKKIFFIKDNILTLSYLKLVNNEMDSDLEAIQSQKVDMQPQSTQLNPKSRISKEIYLERVQTMLDHIHRGDIYEANFCQEFYNESATINPLWTYQKLNDLAQTPFATFLKNHKTYVLSSSPERFLQKSGSTVISQPIKGTSRRSSMKDEDIQLKTNLESDEKERSENIMIVDLVRNDMSKIAKQGSVEVSELCQTYTFNQVHHMISTIRAEVSKEINPVAILQATFPMGSMTGAPKVSAMKIIENLEDTKRGVYSGTVGYFSPNGDFDFNVVIRSILYNSELSYLSFSVGSAITSKSDPEKEYEECLVKAQAMRTVLEN